MTTIKADNRRFISCKSYWLCRGGRQRGVYSEDTKAPSERASLLLVFSTSR